MPKGERHYRTREDPEVYKAAYAQAYWGRRNMERFEAEQPELFGEMQKYMAKGIKADADAQKAGLADEQIGRIHGRALFDALLKISREGGYQYIEYFVT